MKPAPARPGRRQRKDSGRRRRGKIERKRDRAEWRARRADPGGRAARPGAAARARRRTRGEAARRRERGGGEEEYGRRGEGGGELGEVVWFEAEGQGGGPCPGRPLSLWAAPFSLRPALSSDSVVCPELGCLASNERNRTWNQMETRIADCRKRSVQNKMNNGRVKKKKRREKNALGAPWGASAQL